MEHTNIARAEQAYDAYAAQLYRVAYSLLQSRECAEDAVQDAFARYLANDGHFRDGEHEKAWLIRVKVNRCRDLQRAGTVRAYTPIKADRNIWKVSRCCRRCFRCPKSIGPCWCSMGWKVSRWTRWHRRSV